MTKALDEDYFDLFIDNTLISNFSKEYDITRLTIEILFCIYQFNYLICVH